jgi:hypothetical protein
LWLWLENAAHCAANPSPCVLAESAHAFAQLFAAANGATVPDVLAEAFTSAPCRSSCASERAADAVPPSAWTIAAHAPVPLALRHVEHAPVLIALILHGIGVRRCNEGKARERHNEQQS